jgi:hypothetical protein
MPFAYLHIFANNFIDRSAEEIRILRCVVQKRPPAVIGTSPGRQQNQNSVMMNFALGLGETMMGRLDREVKVWRAFLPSVPTAGGVCHFVNLPADLLHFILSFLPLNILIRKIPHLFSLVSSLFFLFCFYTCFFFLFLLTISRSHASLSLPSEARRVSKQWRDGAAFVRTSVEIGYLSYWLTDERVLTLCKSLKRIKSLKVQLCEKITDAAIAVGQTERRRQTEAEDRNERERERERRRR